ncbi:hypothetical protein GCM10027184_51450 [Saccharothrix stipae]
MTALSVISPDTASEPDRMSTERSLLPPAAVMRPEKAFTIGSEDDVARARISSSTLGSALASAGMVGMVDRPRSDDVPELDDFTVDTR